MKPLFYSVFAFFVGSLFYFIVFFVGYFGARRLAYREILRLKRGYTLRVKGLKSKFATVFALCLFLGMGIAWFWTGKLLLGLLFSLSTPLFFRLWARYRQQTLYDSIDHSALSFFYALQGYLRVGKSLPAALFELAHSTDSSFGHELHKHLLKYQDGKALPHLLHRFRARSRLEITGIYLESLDTAYRHGLSLSPLLEKMIPTLETELSSKEKLFELRRGACIQAGIAFLVPWVLLSVFSICEADLFNSFAHSSLNLLVLLLVLVLESIGIGMIWTLSAFY